MNSKTAKNYILLHWRTCFLFMEAGVAGHLFWTSFAEDLWNFSLICGLQTTFTFDDNWYNDNEEKQYTSDMFVLFLFAVHGDWSLHIFGDRGTEGTSKCEGTSASADKIPTQQQTMHDRYLENVNYLLMLSCVSYVINWANSQFIYIYASDKVIIKCLTLGDDKSNKAGCSGSDDYRF